MNNIFSFWGMCLLSIAGYAQQLPYQDSRLPLEQRLNDLVSRMTVEEKCAQLLHESPAISRLGIPEYNWWNEGLHGVARFGRATVFPQPIGIAATFDTDLVYRIATAISDEARAKFNAARAIGNYSQYTGLTIWSPNINIFRDSRWGRGMETWGEDPWLTSRMGVAFVKGLQGNDRHYLKTAACMKHFAVHSGPEGERHSFNAAPPLKDLHETYLPAFEALVKEAHVEATMGAYSALYSEPTCASDLLLNKLLRGKWGFKGHVVSDCWAIKDFHSGHKVTSSPAESAALALKKGVDLNCGETYHALPEALKRGLINEMDIDRAVKNIYRTRFKLGFFDAKEDNPYNAIPLSVVGSAEHKALALEAAVKSVVLLKNKQVLPLKKNMKRLYVMGPHATDVDVLLGNYNGFSNDACTILEGITGKVNLGTRLEYRKGFTYDQENKNHVNWAFTDARGAEAIIVVMGMSTLSEGEEGEAILSDFKSDRKDLNLPKTQLKYLRELRSEIEDIPLIVIVTGGSPVNLREVYELSDALLFAWYPGEQGGNGIADVLFGDNVPSGKLPLTFPMDETQLPDYKDYSMENRTYKYSASVPMFPFGFGLGYSKTQLKNLKLEKSILRRQDCLKVSFDVINSGLYPLDEVVQLYVHTDNPKLKTPLFDLKDIKRVEVASSGIEHCSFEIPLERLYNIDEQGNKVWLKGTYQVYISTSLPIGRSLELGAAQWLKEDFEIR